MATTCPSSCSKQRSSYDPSGYAVTESGYHPSPSAGGYVLSAAGVDDISVEISDWKTGSVLTEISTIPDYPRSIEVAPGMDKGKLTSGIGFVTAESYPLSSTILTFVVRSDTLTSIYVELPGKEEESGQERRMRQLAYELRGGIDRGGGWVEIIAPLSDFELSGEEISAFGIHGGQGKGGTFVITEIQLYRNPWMNVVPLWE